MDARSNFHRPGSDRFDRPEEPLALSELADQLMGFVRRQLPIFIFVVTCAIAVGLVYLVTTPASYTSHAMLLIDSNKLKVLQQQAPLGDVPIDTAQVETQVEILKSENIGLSVIKDMKLTEDPEFVRPGGGLIGTILAFFVSRDQSSETRLTREALKTFFKRRSISRVGRTYVLDISFTSTDPARAAAISNAIADAYIVDQLESKYQATRRASVWLQDRIRELRQQASDADRAVLEYKEKNNIVAVGGNSGSGPRLLGEQQLEELNGQLGSARAQAEEAKARLDRISEVMKKDVPDATVTDSLRNEVINRLRNNYLDIAAKEAIWSARYGTNHLAAVNLRTQMAELRRSIFDELGRIAQGYKSDYEIAKSRIEGLERSLASLVSNSQAINRDRLGLRNLESTAQVYHTIYDNFLQRYMEAIQQQSFPITEARIISSAATPQEKSGPLTLFVLGIAAVIGILISFAAALVREAVDRVFRTTRQVESALKTTCIAVLPKLIDAPKAKSRDRSLKVYGHGTRAPSLSDVDVVSLQPHATGAGLAKLEARGQVKQDKGKRLIKPKREIGRQVINEPLSPFAEAFRSIKVAADIGLSRVDHKVIGITSTVPGEGKSTVSSNLAHLIAHAGKRVILLDGDLRNPSVSRGLASGAQAGLLEVLSNKLPIEDVIYSDEQTGLRFLPSVVSRSLAHTNEILASETFKNFVDGLRKNYEYVIIDLPPIAPVVDVRATTQMVDAYLYVVQWGRTRTNLVQDQLQSFPELQDRLLGVVLNKADVRVLGRYEAYYGRNYYRDRYGTPYAYAE